LEVHGLETRKWWRREIFNDSLEEGEDNSKHILHLVLQDLSIAFWSRRPERIIVLVEIANTTRWMICCKLLQKPVSLSALTRAVQGALGIPHIGIG